MRVTIVGGGIMGLAAAWALSGDGHQVAVYEQGPIPNPLCSSVDRHRLIRHPYGAAAGYTRMVDDAYAAWHRLWDDLGETLYVPTGTLVLVSGEGRWAAESLATLRAQGRDPRHLEGDELARHQPLIEVGRLRSAFFLTTGGALLAERIVAALARYLRDRGVRLHAGCRIAEVDPERARVVLAGGGTVDADALLVAAGPWTGRLVPGLAERVTPSRQVVVYLQPPPPLVEQWRRAPMMIDIGDGSGFYIVPAVDGDQIKIGDHQFSLRGDPDRERIAGDDDIASVVDQCRGRLVGFEGYRAVEARTCFYDVAEGERFIVAPLAPAAWAMTGFSGHGFKFGALMGRLAADAIAARLSPAEITRYAAGN